MIACWKKQDPPSNRIKPLPIRVLKAIVFVALHSNCAFQIATADMIILVFFFLLRPGEYTASPSDTQPFEFKDVQLMIGHRRLCLHTTPDNKLLCSTFATLTFDNQKNGVRGEVIGLARFGDPYLCPVLTIVRRVIHLRTHNAPLSTPLSMVYTNHQWKPIIPADITQTIRHHVHIIGPSLGFLPTDISVRCLRAAGANALLTAKVDTCVITMIGRWHSDQMLRYLHVQNASLMSSFASDMLHSGDYNLLPNATVPMH